MSAGSAPLRTARLLWKVVQLARWLLGTLCVERAFTRLHSKKGPTECGPSMEIHQGAAAAREVLQAGAQAMSLRASNRKGEGGQSVTGRRGPRGGGGMANVKMDRGVSNGE